MACISNFGRLSRRSANHTDQRRSLFETRLDHIKTEDVGNWRNCVDENVWLSVRITPAAYSTRLRAPRKPKSSWTGDVYGVLWLGAAILLHSPAGWHVEADPLLLRSVDFPRGCDMGLAQCRGRLCRWRDCNNRRPVVDGTVALRPRLVKLRIANPTAPTKRTTRTAMRMCSAPRSFEVYCMSH